MAFFDLFVRKGGKKLFSLMLMQWSLGDSPSRCERYQRYRGSEGSPAEHRGKVRVRAFNLWRVVVKDKRCQLLQIYVRTIASTDEETESLLIYTPDHPRHLHRKPEELYNQQSHGKYMDGHKWPAQSKKEVIGHKDALIIHPFHNLSWIRLPSSRTSFADAPPLFFVRRWG